MKRYAIRFLLMCFSVAVPLAHAGHHETSEPAIQYVLTQGYKAADAPATAAAAGEFLKSGALASRGVGMGLYSLDAVTSRGATVSVSVARSTNYKVINTVAVDVAATAN